MESGQVPRAIGVDDKAAPLGGARLRCAGLAIELRLASGCEGLAPAEVHTVTVAGMGGHQVVRILEGVRGVERLVLQPNSKHAVVRGWLVANGWRVDREHVVSERGRWFVVIAGVRGSGELSLSELSYGQEGVQVDVAAWRERCHADRERLIASSLAGAGGGRRISHPTG